MQALATGWDCLSRSSTHSSKSHESHAMGLAKHLLVQSRWNYLSERWGVAQKKEASVQSRTRLMNCKTLCFATITPQNRSISRCGLVSSRFSHGKRRRNSSAIAAMSTSIDSSDDDAQTPQPCLYLKGSVTSGKTIRYPGTVVVLGDVQEGGAVVAEGDVIILGQLHGDVHGGQNGNKSAVVYATQLADARHIRIGESAVALVSTSQFAGCPAIASVQEDGTVNIRAAPQNFNDKVEARNSSKLHEKKASIGSESTASKRPAQLALFTGVYISGVGLALLIFPAPLFGALFDVRSVTVGWIRVGAILAVVFGVYYIGTAIGDMRGSSGARAFYMSTVVGRVFLFFGFCWLVAAGAAQRALLLVGIVNMLGAMSMLFALRQDSTARVVNV